jgi:hypothetical protein
MANFRSWGERAGKPPRRRLTCSEIQAKRVVGYLRCSTDRQEQSIPDQQKAIEKYATKQGFPWRSRC